MTTSNVRLVQAEWAAAINKLDSDKLVGARLDDILADLEVDIDAFDSAETATTTDALFDDADWGPQTPGEWLVGAMLVARMKSFTPTHERHDGNLELSERRIVTGDFEVTGNLELKNDLFVLGNLKVGGYTRDTYSDISHLVVAGNCSAGRGIFSEGFLGVGGRTTAPLVALTFNQGFAKLLAGATAKVIIEADHGGSRIFGAVDCGVVVFDELQIDDEERERQSGDDVKPLLTPAAQAAAADLDGLDFATKLVELTAAGDDVFAR